MSKYLWDIEKFKADSKGLESMIYSTWYPITIDSKGIPVVSSTEVDSRKVIFNDPAYLYTFTSTQNPNYAFYISEREQFSSRLKGYEVDLRGKSLKDYIKKLFPTIAINGQAIGGLKLKDGVGAIKEVANIVYKDSNGNLRNLK